MMESGNYPTEDMPSIFPSLLLKLLGSFKTAWSRGKEYRFRPWTLFIQLRVLYTLLFSREASSQATELMALLETIK